MTTTLRDTSIRRGLDILLCLGEPDALEERGLGVSQIAERLGREKSQVSRTLKILAEYGFVDRDPETLRYRVGWRIHALSTVAGDRRLLDEGTRRLREVVGEFRESAFLSVLQGTEVITIAAETPGVQLQASAWIGRGFPASSSAAGRVLLSSLADDEVRAMFADRDVTTLGPHGINSIDELLERIDETRRRGYGLVDAEFDPDLGSLAAPVRDPSGRVIACLSVSYPTFRMRDSTGRLASFLVRTAADLSHALAGSPPVEHSRHSG